MGNIIIQSKKNKTYKWVVNNRRDIYLLALLLNGNLVLPIKYIKFGIFLNKLNEKLIKNNELIINQKLFCKVPNLNDNWLIGFIDSEGLFTISILNNSNLSSAYKIKFILIQKHEVNKYILEHILHIFNELYNKIDKLPNISPPRGMRSNPAGGLKDKELGKVVPHSCKDVWELSINGLSNCLFIMNYLDKFPLNSNKILRYKKFKEILIDINKKDHLISDKKKKIKELCILINNKKRDI